VKFLERLRFEHLIVVAAAALLVVGGLLFGRRSPRPNERLEEALAGQSTARTASGTLALARLLRKHGVRVETHDRRFELLRPGQGVLFSIGTREPFDGVELDGLEQWVRSGGTFVFAPADEWMPSEGREKEALTPEDALRRFGLTRAKVDAVPHEATVDLGTLGSGLSTYRMQVRGRWRLQDGKVIVLGAAGRGFVVVFADATCFRNDALLEADHAVMLTHLALAHAGSRAVAFDEYHHGYHGGQDALTFIMGTPAGLALLHVILAGIVAVLATGRRLGPARVVHDERRRRPTEFLEAFARLCRASRASGVAVELALTNVTDALHRRFGASDPATIEREAARRGFDGRLARHTLERARGATRGRPSPAELVRLLRDLERVRRGLLGSSAS
jgi:hypothetical protein